LTRILCGRCACAVGAVCDALSGFVLGSCAKTLTTISIPIANAHAAIFKRISSLHNFREHQPAIIF
jgi:hypothetical protein